MSNSVFVARQPILDVHGRVGAYELLFRERDMTHAGDHIDGDAATASVIATSMLVVGLDELTDGKPAYINFTRNLLLGGVPSMLPANRVTVEVLESVVPDADVIAACRQLKQDGYVIALDDFVFAEQYRPLIGLADIIKVDFQQTRTLEERRAVIQQCDSDTVRFLAEKVETHEDFRQARELGYTLFQGFFFRTPDVVQRHDVPASKLQCMRLIKEIHRPDAEIDNLEQIICHDVALSYKLLRFINSAYFGLQVRIESIRHALTLLGMRDVQKWASIVVLSTIGEDKPQELLISSLVRARFCEQLATHLGMAARQSDLFLLGLFSCIDAFMDQPMDELVAELPLGDDVRAALLGAPNRFRDVLELVRMYETGQWESTAQRAATLELDDALLPDLFLPAVKWASLEF